MKRKTSLCLLTKLASIVCLLLCTLGSAQAAPPTLVGPSDIYLDAPQETSELKVFVTGTAPFEFEWRKEGVVLPTQTTNAIKVFGNQTNMAGFYQVIVRNGEGSVTSRVAVVSIACLTNLVADLNPGGEVLATIMEADGSLIIGGSFVKTGSSGYKYLVRVLPNGTLDRSFYASPDAKVTCLAIEPDGSILVGGEFSKIGSLSRRGIARFFSDGTLDLGFDAKLNGNVTGLARQPDGKVVLAGGFSQAGGKAWRGVARVNPDGTPDPGFDSTGAVGVNTVALQPDGCILVGGSFTSLGGQPRNNFGRLLPWGALDLDFIPTVNGQVYSIALDRNSRIVVGGVFSTINGQSVNRLARLMTDGTVDPTFASAANASVFSLALQADGKILVGGDFNLIGGLSRAYLGRLLPDGRADPLFDPIASSSVRCVSVLVDGSVAVGGSFTSIGGASRRYFARLAPNGPAISELTWNDSSVSWSLGGSCPEVSQATFEVFESGQGWRSIGTGTPTAIGWELNGVTIAPGSTVRARGGVSGGRYCGSGSEMSGSAGPPIIISSRLSILGSCPLSVVACGSPPLSYQWYEDGKPVAGGTNQWLAKVPVEGKVLLAVVTSPSGIAKSETATVRYLGLDVFNYAAKGYVRTIAVQPDGKLIISGVAQSSGGDTYYLIRLNSNGTSDSSFNSHIPSFNGVVLALAVQLDGKVLIGGNFSHVAGVKRFGLARLNADGTLDDSFNPKLFSTSSGGSVSALVVQTDGAILVGGYIGFSDAVSQLAVGRLLPDGSLDSSFVPPAYSIGSGVDTISVLPDQSIVIGGTFRQSTLVWAGERLSSSGATLARTVRTRNGMPMVRASSVQAEGKVLLGGTLVSESPGPQSLVWLNDDMSIDTNRTRFVDGPVYCLAAQAGGKTLVGGGFTSIGGVPCTNLARLRDDGTVDPTFNHSITGTNVAVMAIASQLDGKTVMGGRFEEVDGVGRINLARLQRLAPKSSKIWSDGYSIIWTPESEASLFYDVAFSYSMDSSNWTPLGVAARQDRSWQVPATVPYGATIRMQAFASSSGVSSWVSDSRFGAPEFLKQPVAQTNAAGGFVLLSASVSGLEDVEYQWYKGNLPLADGPFAAGANSSSLALGNLALSQGGNYFLVASNILGCTTSSVVELTIRTRPSEILAKDSDFGFQEGKFGFGVKATPGTSCVLLVSSNLVDWVPVQTNLVHQADGVIRLSDPQSSQTARRFYRVAYEQ